MSARSPTLYEYYRVTLSILTILPLIKTQKYTTENEIVTKNIKNYRKKVAITFGSYIKMLYLCTRNREITMQNKRD